MTITKYVLLIDIPEDARYSYILMYIDYGLY